MSLSTMKYGCKVIMNLEAAAKKVMQIVLKWGTPGKDPKEDFITYVKRLDPSTSKTNYVLEDKKRHPKLDKTQKDKVENYNSSEKFDISLLLIVIKLCCINMALLNDAAWFSDGDELENLLYQIKKARNNAMHESLEMTETEFEEKTKKLREDLIATLTKAKERFGRSDAELKEEIDKNEVVMNTITNEPLDLKDFLRDYHSDLQEHTISRLADQLKQHSTYQKSITPISFLTTNKVKLPVNKIYMATKIMQGRPEGKEKDVDHRDLIKLVQGQSNQPQVLVVEGLAGSGKTTLADHMTTEWSNTSSDSIRGLNEYKLLLKVQCRDPHLSCYVDLVGFLFQPSTTEYKELLSKLVMESSLLVIIDGIDEVNKSSRELIRDILHQMQGNPKCTVMFTTRPEALQEGLQLIPNTYYRVEVELVGIPTGQRKDFLHRYLDELHKTSPGTTPTPPTTDDINQCIKQLDVETKEHFRLPLNLSIVAILMYSWPDKMNRNTTQTELYYLIHELTLEKLEKRLIDNDLTKDFGRRKRLDKVENWLSTLYCEMFIALTHDQLTLQEESVNKLRSKCDTLDLPPDEMMAAFMETRTVKTFRGCDLDCYSVPHKGFQERYGALYIIQGIKQLKKPDDTGNVTNIVVSTPGVGQILHSKMQNLIKKFKKPKETRGCSARQLEELQQQPKETGNVISIIRRTPGAAQIQLSKMQNLLQMLVGMIPHDWDSIMVKDVLNLLQEAGVNRRNQWLDVIEDTKCSEKVVKAIADHFPLPGASVSTGGNYGPIEIIDGRIATYEKLLLHIRQTQVRLNIHGDPASLNCLLASLARHVCKGFRLYQTFYHPTKDIHPDVDQLLSKVQWSPDLNEYSGPLTDYVLSRLQRVHSLRDIELSISSNHQATLLMELITSTSFKHLKLLSVAVTPEVLPAAITTNLPGNYISVMLYLLDVTDERVSWACEMVANLINPSQRGYDIRFPRSTLDEAGWIRMIQDLGGRGVKNMRAMWVSDTSISSDQADRIRQICSNTFGAYLTRCLATRLDSSAQDTTPVHRTRLQCTGHDFSAQDTTSVHRTRLQCTGHDFSAQETTSVHRRRLQCTGDDFSAEETTSVQRRRLQCRGHDFSAEDTTSVQRTRLQCRGHDFSAEDTTSVHRTRFQCTGHDFSAQDTTSVHRTRLQCTGHDFSAQDTTSVHRTRLQCTGHDFSAQDTTSVHRTRLQCTGHDFSAQDTTSVQQTLILLEG
ncbi:hypothetical protein Pcinc_001968 [Petrolisthes cinctipes]|uniref:NACHT domain-containing protein n=1 Tax=Petrolisthes cinctipes TaxID=88211 RepID=A0AAE1GMB6_PETCI|nr:hypothetical protein Pcinc_001968 [Petrolisthes cinctipes]